jgi:hypothetical protein
MLLQRFPDYTLGGRAEGRAASRAERTCQREARMQVGRHSSVCDSFGEFVVIGRRP